MTSPNDRSPATGDAAGDSALSARFAEARAHEAGSIPPFGRVVAGRATRSPRRWLVPSFALGATALLALAAVTWRRGPHDAAPPIFAFVPGQLRVPTDYFLELTPSLRANELPDIGSVDWYPLEPAPVPSSSTTRRSH